MLADLLLLVGMGCMVVSVGLNVSTLVRVSAARDVPRARRIRFAAATVAVACVGLACCAVALALM